MTISIYFDQRAAKDGQPAPIKFAIRKNGKAAYINTGIKVTAQQWSKTKSEVTNHPNAKRINLIISKKRLEIDSAILKLMEAGESGGLTALQLRDNLSAFVVFSSIIATVFYDTWAIQFIQTISQSTTLLACYCELTRTENAR